MDGVASSSYHKCEVHFPDAILTYSFSPYVLQSSPVHFYLLPTSERQEK